MSKSRMICQVLINVNIAVALNQQARVSRDIAKAVSASPVAKGSGLHLQDSKWCVFEPRICIP